MLKEFSALSFFFFFTFCYIFDILNYREAGSVVYFHNAVLYIFNGADFVFATLLLERVMMRAIILIMLYVLLTTLPVSAGF